jgi:outer membrane protein assembly factor BamD (BamD/ComL family)
MLKMIATAAVVAAAMGLAACDGSAEKAGENMDSAIEEATQGQENLGDGPLEQAGEGLDEATGNQQNNDAADALNDATDGDASTNP